MGTASASATLWSIDGENVAAHGAMLEIPAKTRRGSSIELRVTASDGHAESEAFVVSTVVGNREPRISGLVIQPAGHITALRADHGGGDGLGPRRRCAQLHLHLERKRRDDR